MGQENNITSTAGWFKALIFFLVCYCRKQFYLDKYYLLYQFFNWYAKIIIADSWREIFIQFTRLVTLTQSIQFVNLKTKTQVMHYLVTKLYYHALCRINCDFV